VQTAEPRGECSHLHPAVESSGERTFSDLGRRVRSQVDAYPIATAVAATCVGFALGGGVTRGLLTLLLGAGVRIVGTRLGDSLLERGRPPLEETQ
jgi:hypothetical protein